VQQRSILATRLIVRALISSNISKLLRKDFTRHAEHVHVVLEYDFAESILGLGFPPLQEDQNGRTDTHNTNNPGKEGGKNSDSPVTYVLRE
jgi:hypothetical protein